MPLVSVVVPTHNRPEMLAEALASVRAQTFADYEIIVVSNESDAARRQSLAVATSYGAQYFAMPEGNLPIARNFGIEHAKGDWIAFLDDDDLWLPQKLERQLAEARRTDADMICCNYIAFWPDGREKIGSVRLPRGWTFHKAICHQKWCAAPSAVIIRASVLRDLNGFDPQQCFAEDYDLWRRLAERHKIVEMREPLIRRRLHALSMMRDAHSTGRYNQRFVWKMLRDTPPDLRWAVPSRFTRTRRSLLRLLTPWCLRHPRKYFAELLRPESPAGRL